MFSDIGMDRREGAKGKMKRLVGITMGMLGFTLLMFIIGLTSQNPVGFAGALLCGMPLFAFFLGGTAFTLFSRYRVVPKDEDMRVVSANARHRQQREIVG